MIQVTNDWILKSLPNNDIQTPNSYTNDISCECFEPLINLTSNYYPYGDPKYIESSTGIILPVYQPAPDDVSYWWGQNSSQWQYFASGGGTSVRPTCESRYDSYGKFTEYITIARTSRDVDSNNRETKYGVADLNGNPVKFKFFNPDTKLYDKDIYLRYTLEYKKYKSDGRTKRSYPYRRNYFWEDDTGNRTYIFPRQNNHKPQGFSGDVYPGQHFNLSADEIANAVYPETGDALIGAPHNIYMYTDIGFDVINEKWVGLLNMYMHLTANDYNYVNFSREDYYSASYPYRIIAGLSVRNQIGPFSGISATSYTDAVGAYSGLLPFYMRAFELEDFEPSVQNITIPMTKIGCYGPNTRISP